MIELSETYINNVKKRSYCRFYIGFFARLFKYIKYSFYRIIARHNGAEIGEGTIIPYKLAKKCNTNLHIGEDCILETDDLDLRSPIFIGNHCILNKHVSIIRVSHYIDDDTDFSSRYYPDLVIDDYSWIATGAKILPSCCHIEVGSVIGAYSVMVKNSETMGVYSGNPAHLIRKHNTIFKDKLVISMMGGDFIYYIKNR